MTVELDTLDLIEVDDSWDDIVRRSQQPPLAQLVPIDAADRRPVRWRHVASGLTAAACVVGALFIARDRAVEERQTDPASTASAVAPQIAALPRLASLALPTTIPDGWRLVELTTAPLTRNQSVERAAGQLFRRTGDGATISLLIMPLDVVETLTPEIVEQRREDIVFEAGTASFREAGADITVLAHGVGADESAAFVRQLRASGSAAGLRYTSDASDWLLEHTSAYEPPTPDRNPFGVVTYRSDDGRTASFRLTNDGPDNRMWRVGVPVEIDGVTIYRTEGGATRQLGPLLVVADFLGADPSDDELELLTSFALVESATWGVAADQLADTAAALPTLVRLSGGGVTVTLHADDGDRVLCASNGVVTRCVPDRIRWSSGSRSQSFGGDVNLDGTWVHLLALDADDLNGLEATTDAGPAQTAWTSTADGDVLIAAIAPPDATTMDVVAQVESVSFWGVEAVRTLD